MEYFIQYRCISDKNVSMIIKKGKKKKTVLISELSFVSTVERIDKRDDFFFFLFFFFSKTIKTPPFPRSVNPPPPEAVCRNETDYQLFSIAVYVTMTSSLVSLSWEQPFDRPRVSIQIRDTNISYMYIDTRENAFPRRNDFFFFFKFP